ncbi:CoA ester lyase [Pseudomonas sp. W4I3]|uniref:HpcH/HpaI aldolase/citrate lyase family protein n=1 Tax=Pseudomonas sp. W4I3 TaxID=3042294 RepID=UPI002789742B|nr:CoA ester lyase [Pseudomonas sp. W4I3]MDQ0740062.1 citrate lyase beta subunit [Pseudomonas sp. W4I3]
MDMLVRSWLCIPALKEGLEQKIVQSTADIVLLDLEDSIPIHKKSLAREKLLKLDRSIWHQCNLAVRINAPSKPEGIRDLVFLMDNNIVPKYLVVPKVESSGELRVLGELMSAAGGRTQCFGIVETLKGLRRIDAIINESMNLHGLILGSADLSSEISFRISKAALMQIKCEMALAALSVGLKVIDTPCFNLRCETRLKDEIESAKSLGYSGKIAIHPSQVALINKLFSPSQEELDRAEAIFACLESPELPTAIASIDGDMIGPPFAVLAEKLLATQQMVINKKT